jgi:DNA-binding NtrC family response regulator
MTACRCRFHVVGSDISFQTVTAVETELLGDSVQTLFYPTWAACDPQGIRAGETIIGHMGDANGTQLFRHFVQRIKDEKMAMPRILVVADHLDMPLEIELLKLGVTECLMRPLNLRRFSYLLQSIFIKSKSITQAEASQEAAHGRDLVSRIAKLSSVASNVLITGETGVGKSYFAKELHLASPRALNPFVAVNCAAIPEHLFESELFGHERGSFTGAERRHIGKLEFAGEGTVLLDDVDALPSTIQPKLLHAVENREFYPVGSNRAIKFQARLLSATNCKLEELASRGAFRSDLMYRLNTYELPISPLRARPTEISQFVSLFVQQFAVENGRPHVQVCPTALDALMAYPWPGNVRELRNAIQFGAIDSEDGVIRKENLPARIRDFVARRDELAATHSIPHWHLAGERSFLDDVRRLIQALVRNNFNRTNAAADLGYSRTTLYQKLEKLKLN